MSRKFRTAESATPCEECKHYRILKKGPRCGWILQPELDRNDGLDTNIFSGGKTQQKCKYFKRKNE